MDLREYLGDAEETIRTALGGLMKRVFTSMPVVVSQTSKDGHRAELKLAIKAQVVGRDGKFQTVEYPLLQDVPIHFIGGGDVILTHPVSKGDEGLAIFASRNQDATMQSGDVQAAIDDRINSLSDARYIPGGRSDPRKVKNVATDAAHLRSVDGKNTIEHHPTSGTKIKIVDPSDTASNPFTGATKFFQSVFHPTSGIIHAAVDGANTHRVAVDHAIGPLLSALNGKHTVSAHPTNGPAMSGDNGAHKVELLPGVGVKITSAIKTLIDAPAVGVTGLLGVAGIGGLLGGALNTGGGPSSGIGAGAMQDGAAATNVGTLGGDLSGTLPEPSVVNMSNLHHLPDCANDAAAALAGVSVGKLYRTGSQLMVRVA